MSDGARIPIIRLRGNLLVSIQVALSDQVVADLKDDVASEIQKAACGGLVIDVSGIDIMDSYISRTIRDIGIIARLMGVRPVICGLGPTIAITLVEMGMDMQGIDTARNLDAAVAWLDSAAGARS